ncbi:hypothetical protein DXG03_001144 [Asterophora parasitica]|uniref:Uncharacterized protein n=1 Tax=Asterophora parasitica TaxID=117018 RepID=A0A9P7GH20_9AGAR|nr:hypothetical protein DXG03_001144 [Asterophora parasitica]
MVASRPHTARQVDTSPLPHVSLEAARLLQATEAAINPSELNAAMRKYYILVQAMSETSDALYIPLALMSFNDLLSSESPVAPYMRAHPEFRREVRWGRLECYEQLGKREDSKPMESDRRRWASSNSDALDAMFTLYVHECSKTIGGDDYYFDTHERMAFWREIVESITGMAATRNVLVVRQALNSYNFCLLMHPAPPCLRYSGLHRTIRRGRMDCY